MKFICTQNDLNNHLSLVNRVVPQRPTHPILSNILVEADDQLGRVYLTAFDLAIGVKSSFACQVETGGQVTLPAKLLSDIVSRLPDGDITLSTALDETATITCKSGKYQVRGMSAEEFPELPEITEQTILLKKDRLLEGIRSTLFATSADETKQVLTGVHITISEGKEEFASTDGHRLAIVETIEETPPTEEEVSVVLPTTFEELNKALTPKPTTEVNIPSRVLTEVEKILLKKESDEIIKFKFDRGQAVFEWCDRIITTRLLEGQYPDYRQLLPPSFEKALACDRKGLLSILDRIAVLADPKQNIVKVVLDSSSQVMTLSIDAKDVGSGRETMPVQYAGENMELALNIKYWRESLNNLATQEIEMRLNQPLSPIVLSPIGGAKVTHLLMPVQLRN